MMDFERFMEEAQQDASKGSGKPGEHPTEASLWSYAAGGLVDQQQWQIGAHLGQCSACRDKVQALRLQLDELAPLIEPHLQAPVIESRSPHRSASALQRALKALDALLLPRPLALHAASFAVGAFALFGLNVLVNIMFPPPSDPLGSPGAPRWWAWIVIALWAVVVGAHGVAAMWKRWTARRSGQGRKE